MELSRSYLFLHKNEWNRLKSVGAPTRDPRKTNEHVQSLIEKSQQWINSWPDSVQGHILEVERQKKKQLAKNLAMVKLFKKKQKEIYKKNKYIEKAKQVIFDDSCYGRKLISALLESKTLEERSAQIEFQKKIKASASTQDIQYNDYTTINMKNQEEQMARKREEDKAVARVNKTIYLTELENKKRDKEREKELEIEDLRLIAELNEQETIQKANEKIQFKKDLEQFKVEQKQIQDRNAIREKQEERTIDIWRKYEDRKNITMKRIHERRFNNPQSRQNYELVQRLNDDVQNRYDEFVNKGILKLTQRLQIEEHENNQNKVDERKKQNLLRQANKQLEEAKRIIENNKKISTCDRQCIIPKCKNIAVIKQLPQEQDNVTFSTPNNRLLKNLRMREMKPSPWNSLPAAHAQFARHADLTLQECHYKHAARKVVDDYRRQHGLKPQDLPIVNYL